MPTSLIEQASFQETIQPWLARFLDARVLDLACGTGYYAKKLLDWGAGYVLGADSSGGMVGAAEDLIRKDKCYTGRLNFQVGNALDLGKIGDEKPFDIVVGIWLLNYASDLEEMTRMYCSISANLKDGGVSIAVTPPPAEDMDAFAKDWTEITASTYRSCQSG